MRIVYALALILSCSTASWADEIKKPVPQPEASSPASDGSAYEGCSHSKKTS